MCFSFSQLVSFHHCFISTSPILYNLSNWQHRKITYLTLGLTVWSKFVCFGVQVLILCLVVQAVLIAHKHEPDSPWSQNQKFVFATIEYLLRTYSCHHQFILRKLNILFYGIVANLYTGVILGICVKDCVLLWSYTVVNL